MAGENKGQDIKFGFLDREGKVVIARIAPDSEGLPWFEDTDTVESLEGREEMGKSERSVSGQCIDTAEYISPAVSLVREMLAEAPPEARLAVVGIWSATGTKTWREGASLTYYS